MFMQMLATVNDFLAKSVNSNLWLLDVISECKSWFSVLGIIDSIHFHSGYVCMHAKASGGF